MSQIELGKFSELITTLEDRPLKNYCNLLKQVGNYYKHTIPSEVNLEYVKETERLLNNLYIRSTEELLSSQIHRNMKQTLGIASSISFAIKLRNFGPETFTLLKDMSEALINISSTLSRTK